MQWCSVQSAARGIASIENRQGVYLNGRRTYLLLNNLHNVVCSSARRGHTYIAGVTLPTSKWHQNQKPETRMDTRGRAEDHKQSMGVMNAPLFIFYHYISTSVSLSLEIRYSRSHRIDGHVDITITLNYCDRTASKYIPRHSIHVAHPRGRGTSGG